MDYEIYKTKAQNYRNFRSNNILAVWTILKVAGLGTLGVFLSLKDKNLTWLLGQLFLGLSLVQWFVLLHDFGHGKFFRQTYLNTVLGWISSIIVIIPFDAWAEVHHKHHLWTGWRDIDPTTAIAYQKKTKKWISGIVNICWLVGFPIFSLSFSVSCFWNLPRLLKIFNSKSLIVKVSCNILLIISIYCLLIFSLGQTFFRVWALSYGLFLYICDPLLLSQHAHLPMNAGHENEKEVKPIRYHEQDQYTRSLLYPEWVSRFVLIRFDRHIEHHYFPQIPIYYLGRVEHSDLSKKMIWWHWLIKAKSLKGTDLVLKDSKTTQIYL